MDAGNPKNVPDVVRDLERESRRLDWQGADFNLQAAKVSSYLQSYLDGLPDSPAYSQTRRPPLATTLPLNPAEFSDVLSEFHAATDKNGILPTCSRFFGYVPGGGIPVAGLGDYLAAVTNYYSGVYQASPGASAIDNVVVRWLCEIVGFPSSSFGTLVSGGTLATVSCFVAAKIRLKGKDQQKAVIYLTTETHKCVEKALVTTGLDTLEVRYIALNDRLAMCPQALGTQIKKDLGDGLEPWLVVGTAGSVNTGAIDPLPELRAVCDQYGMWLHIDAAYGGFFVLAPSLKESLRSMKAADSLVLDPHKGLFQPYGLGAALVRDSETLKASFAYQADYLADVHDPLTPSPADYSPELTRHFRALRLWCTLKTHGLQRLATALEEKRQLALLLYDGLAKKSDLYMGPKPELSCVTFAVREGSQAGRSDIRTQRLLDTLLKRGKVHLSSTKLGQHLFLRACIVNFRSHYEDIVCLSEEIDYSLQ